MIRGIDVEPSANDLRPLLEQWLTNFERACEAFPQTEDAWYVERTLSSLLSAASWQLGVPSIIEAKAKRPGTQHPKLDLLLHAETGAIAIEGKIAHIPYPDDVHRVKDALAEAVSDAASVEHRLAKRYFGVSFGVLEQQVPETDLAEVLWLAVQEARNIEPRPSLIAWVLLDHDARYRGCVVAAREADTSAA
jgi:hypothetical protein